MLHRSEDSADIRLSTADEAYTLHFLRSLKRLEKSRLREHGPIHLKAICLEFETLRSSHFSLHCEAVSYTMEESTHGNHHCQQKLREVYS